MLNQALRLIRTYHDLSQTELCSELGLSNSYLSEIESGKKQPSLEILKKYSEQFDIPLSSILFFSENLEAPKPSDKFRKNIAEKIITILEWNESRINAKETNKKKAKMP
ncbi:helix-turn-helix domain-containing protein [Methylobacter sp. BlB1]|uniref:helix-turn-helix domain-containing protein n=1 Tax=Methylobacter sp. BlB1 TaxID=2785914 RepID=UPI0018933180|nr:helix-turn-helix transcriptional regulator [Methylobacter sp. BlB1]MBF6648034.1 helix-turn-helix domain-containing protein [Methylobacter sp. BlB1]